MYSQGNQELKGRETGDKENAPNPAQSSADSVNSRLAGTEATADSSKGMLRVLDQLIYFFGQYGLLFFILFVLLQIKTKTILNSYYY